jgi:hypothetical protein
MTTLRVDGDQRVRQRGAARHACDIPGEGLRPPPVAAKVRERIGADRSDRTLYRRGHRSHDTTRDRELCCGHGPKERGMRLPWMPGAPAAEQALRDVSNPVNLRERRLHPPGRPVRAGPGARRGQAERRLPAGAGPACPADYGLARRRADGRYPTAGAMPGLGAGRT